MCMFEGRTPERKSEERAPGDEGGDYCWVPAGVGDGDFEGGTCRSFLSFFLFFLVLRSKRNERAGEMIWF